MLDLTGRIESIPSLTKVAEFFRSCLAQTTARCAAAIAMLACVCVPALADTGPRHAIAMHGDPALPQGFAHFRYVNPAAPKGGRLVEGVLGTFDNLNPFIVKGLAAQGLRAPLTSAANVITGYVVESLMVRSYDEPFTLYGLLARTVETDSERSFVTFSLDADARFADGQPVTAADVVFSWRLLRDHGRPNHRTYYSKVRKVDVIDERTVRFGFSGSEDRELPLILGLMPVLPQHAVNAETFEDGSFTPLLGSGPYRISKVDPGKSLTLTRNAGYWGRDRSVNRGFWNFDEVRYDYYRDANSYHEAFKRGLFDARTENDPGRWQSGYDFPALNDGLVVKEAIPSALPSSSSFFVFNTRRAIFADIRVREAIALLFDFEWANRNLYFGLYRRTASYFDGSELSSHGRAADARERALLAPFSAAARPDVMDGSWAPPGTDGSGRDRTTLRRALTLFSQAGYELRGTELVERRTGTPLAFEIMITTRSEGTDEERLALQFASNLKRAAIAVRVRPVDAVQFEQRRIGFDFDMIQARWDQSLSPGNEQAFYWGSAAADEPGSRNYIGVRAPSVDAMIAKLLHAREREDFVTAVRALDRVLISGMYVVPLFHLPDQWLARWTYIERPHESSRFGYLPETWWRGPRTQ